MKINLRTSLFFLFFISTLIRVSAQMVYIPDSMFRAKLVHLGYATCITGDSINSSCPLVVNTTSLDVSNGAISNLQGIEAFDSLVTLRCSNNNLTFLPPLPDSLGWLICESNQLTSLPSLPPALQSLSCKDNQLTSLPVFPAALEGIDCSYNQITSLPVMSSALNYLYCPYNQLTSIPTLPVNLWELVCNDNLITSLPLLPQTIYKIYCFRNQLTSLPALPSALTELECGYNLITSLPSLPVSLYRLGCSNNQLATLPVLPASLQQLVGDDNQLTSIPALPASMTLLTVSSNQISSLPSLPSTLLQLGCANNLLTSLPVLPSQLTWLFCSLNQLTSLPSLPAALYYLNCDNNQLSSLPFLQPSLKEIHCSFNNLSVLPVLPDTLNKLFCRHNQISSLPSLPNTITILNCGSNQLTTIPSIPSSLKEIECDSNQITFIPELPDTMYTLGVSSNPQLNCLPKLTNINNLYFGNSGINCIPNYGNVLSSWPLINTFPLCDVFNTNGCNFFWNINGKIFLDPDTDCLQSGNETGLINTKVNLYQNGNLLQQAFTESNGRYSFDVTSFGNYEVRLDSALPFTINCPASGSYQESITITDSLAYNDDFAVICKPGFDLGAWSIFAEPFRAAHHSKIIVNAGDIANHYGVHCASGISGSVIININGNAHYSGPAMGALPPSNVSGNTITYNIADFGNINSNTSFQFDIITDTAAQFGSSICIDAAVAPTLGDNDVTNNVLMNCHSVISSFDPNFKEVYPEGITDTSQHYLTYTIHFQNTGNASADNIYILDTLDHNIDVSSIQILSASHPAFIQILNGGIAKFNFPNINLPDSTSNEPASHGYVQYKVKLKDNLQIGTQIHNKAYIYFDFNSPVVTNTTSNTIDINNNISLEKYVSQIKVWPVPFKNEFTFSCDHFSKNSHYSVINLLGDEVLYSKMDQTQITISAADWQPGVYFLRVESYNGLAVRKLVKN